MEQQKNLPDRVEPPELFTVSAWSCETLASKELSLRECSVVHESRSASISITNQPTVSTPAIHHRVAKCKALRSQLSAARGLRHVNALRLPWLNCSALMALLPAVSHLLTEARSARTMVSLKAPAVSCTQVSMITAWLVGCTGTAHVLVHKC